jgi:hypothetical protein
MPIITNEDAERLPPREVIYEHKEHRTEVEPRPTTERRTERREEIVSGTAIGGSSLQLIGGAGAVVLAIIGLAGYRPGIMAAIATIAIGAGLFAHGSAASAHVSRLLKRSGGAEGQLTGGLGSEVFGGLAAIALGILALVGVLPTVLLPVAAIVLGSAILLGAPAEARRARLVVGSDRRGAEAVEGISGAMALAGVGAIALGILALLRVGPQLTLVMVAMLAVGGALFLEGTALTARFARRMRHGS